jgi:ABC-type multidrug transport system fused ATPase/permease subunit
MATADESSTGKSFKELSRAAWDATVTERFRLFLFIGLFIFAYSIDLLVPWAIGYTIAALVKEGFTDTAYQQALYGLAAYAGLRLLHTLFHHVGRYVQNTVAYTARMATLTKLFDTLMVFPLNWHVRHHSGESISKIHRSTGAVDQTIGTYIWQIIEGTVKVVFASVAILYLDFWVAVNVMVMAFLTIFFMIFFNKRLVSRIRRNNWFYDKINRICVDYLSNIVTVKTLNLEQAAGDYLKKHRDDGLRLSQKISKYSELKWGTTGIGYAIVITSSLYIYFQHHRAMSAGAFDVQALYVLLNYLDRIYQAIGSFTGYYSGLVEASTAYEDASSIIAQAEALKQSKTDSHFRADWNSIQIHSLSFKYGKEDKTVLRSVGFNIHRNEKIALVGPSGGGKSTFLKIMGGLLIPEEYHVSSDKQDSVLIGDVARISLLVPQEPEVFSESVRYNLTMGDEYSDEVLKKFTGLCRVDRVIEKLPLGMENNLAEKGLNLSVGEKQRLALCRGLLKVESRDILLLDEPTSSLDPQTEKDIFVDLLKEFRNRTIISACHRLALVPLFDKIIYVRHGVIEEVGTFEELIAKRGSFYLAWDDFEKRLVKDASFDSSQQII